MAGSPGPGRGHSTPPGWSSWPGPWSSSARSEAPAQNEWQRVYQDSEAHVDRLFALHYRLVGRILACAQTAEASLEQRPPVLPAEQSVSLSAPNAGSQD